MMKKEALEAAIQLAGLDTPDSNIHIEGSDPVYYSPFRLGEGAAITAIVPAANVHASPESHFEIDPRALIDAHKAARAGGPQVIGYYHSHPNGDPRPSTTDRASAAHDGMVWAIAAAGEVRFFRDGEERFEALSYIVQPR